MKKQKGSKSQKAIDGLFGLWKDKPKEEIDEILREIRRMRGYKE